MVYYNFLNQIATSLQWNWERDATKKGDGDGVQWEREVAGV